jgi:hypothetical protein
MMFKSNPKDNWGCHGYLCTVQTLVHPRPKNVQISFGGKGRGGGGGGALL